MADEIDPTTRLAAAEEVCMTLMLAIGTGLFNVPDRTTRELIGKPLAQWAELTAGEHGHGPPYKKRVMEEVLHDAFGDQCKPGGPQFHIVCRVLDTIDDLGLLKSKAKTKK